MTMRQKMRRLIERTGYTMVPGAYDTLTARLVEQAGFDAVYLTGGGYSRANGYPDLGLLTLSENVRFIGLTVEAVGIPVIADADTGYGNAINVIRTVREYEKSGVAALPPRRSGLAEEMRPLRRQGGHLARRDGRQDQGRGRHPAGSATWSSSPAPTRARSRGWHAAIDRVNAYLEAGADVGFVEAPQNVEELRIVGATSFTVRPWSMCSKAARRRWCRPANSKPWASASASIRRRPIAPRSGPRKRC